MKDPAFVSHTTVVESAAWCSYMSMVKESLGKKRADCYQDIVKQMLTNFQTLGARMCINLHYLFSHLGRFPDTLGDVSEEQGKRFHQAIKTMEPRYRGGWFDRHMMSDYCWNLMRDSNQQNYKRKSYKRAFQQVDWPNLAYRGQRIFCFVYIGMQFQCHFAMYSSMFSDTQFINKR